jgi:hypothetical protein
MGLTTDLCVLVLVSFLMFFLYHLVLFKHPNILLALFAFFIMLSTNYLLLLISVPKYLNFITCSVGSLSISNLTLVGSLNTVNDFLLFT